MNKLAQLAVMDLKLIFRDMSLRIFLAMPLLIFALVLGLLPSLLEQFESVEAFVPIVIMGATMQTSTMFGFIYAMVLINEKDIQVAKVYGVLPVSKTGFVTSRMAIPFAISTLFTFVLLVLQPFYSFFIVHMLVVSLLSAAVAPVLALGVTVLSKNKMEGMTWFKLVNLLISLPFAAFFIEQYASWFGIVPTHWLFQAIDGMISGGDTLVPFILTGLYLTILLVVLVRRFAKVHFA